LPILIPPTALYSLIILSSILYRPDIDIVIKKLRNLKCIFQI
jgi:hypothetical protein